MFMYHTVEIQLTYFDKWMLCVLVGASQGGNCKRQVFSCKGRS